MRKLTERVTNKLLGIDGLKEIYTMGEMSRLGGRVTYFMSKDSSEAPLRDALAFREAKGGTLFGGIHKHLVNRTDDYCVVSE
jgi:hypothetical protein